MKRTLLLGLVQAISAFLYADITLPKLFSDNMVLQRDCQLPVWGWADRGEKITVQFNTQTKTTTTGKDGKWMIRLDKEQAGGPYQLFIKGKKTIRINNVLVGEVWICSGQSNMEMPIAGWGKVNNYLQEIANADYPSIRHFKVPNSVASVPEEKLKGGDWKICNPQNAGDFSAAGYFFARELFLKLHVPIGLINTTWGGTDVETWISRGSFEKSDEFKTMIASVPSLGLEGFIKQRKDALIKKIIELQGPLKDSTIASHWKDKFFDDSRWPHMKLPGLWEQQGMGLEDLDGKVWFRKILTISQEDAGKPAVLNLGKVDDSDETFVNGIWVGETKNKYGDKRSYKIAAGVLLAGKNVIAVRVDDTGGGGGIYGNADDMELVIGNENQPLAGEWNFQVESVLSGNAGIGPNSYPTLLYNAMVNPLVPYAMRGVIWYQGEANAGRAFQYRRSFPMLISDWRGHWGEGNFPFLFVQLASFNAADGNSQAGSTWAELREAQAMALSLPHTGMVVTTDIGESSDIHPKNKQEVGKRLAAIALDNTYELHAEYSGPVFQSMKKEGNTVKISFTHTGAGLMAKDKYGYVKGFEIAGSDKHFHYARASISGDLIFVSSDSVSDPVSIRYGWSDDAGEANLFNRNGFPALPFRTDQWKGITEDEKYTIGK